MINLILLFPLAAVLILFIFKKDYLNNLMLNIYAILHFIVSLAFCTDVDLLPFWKSTSFFEVTNKNIVF